MPITQGLTTSFKQDCLSGKQDFSVTTPYTYKIALYNGNANIGADTTTYAATSNELPTGGGYTAGGKILTVIPPMSNAYANTAYISFANVTWNPASFTCRGALIYNSTTGTTVCVLNFGSDKTASNTFTVTFPADTSSDAIIRFS
jgi:hypothetical protein